MSLDSNYIKGSILKSYQLCTKFRTVFSTSKRTFISTLNLMFEIKGHFYVTLSLHVVDDQRRHQIEMRVAFFVFYVAPLFSVGRTDGRLFVQGNEKVCLCRRVRKIFSQREIIGYFSRNRKRISIRAAAAETAVANVHPPSSCSRTKKNNRQTNNHWINEPSNHSWGKERNVAETKRK